MIKESHPCSDEEPKIVVLINGNKIDFCLHYIEIKTEVNKKMISDFPESHTVRRQLPSSVKGDSFFGEQVGAICRLGVEWRKVRFIINVYCHKNSFAVAGTLKDKLLVPHMKVTVTAVIECRMLGVEFCV